MTLHDRIKYAWWELTDRYKKDPRPFCIRCGSCYTSHWFSGVLHFTRSVYFCGNCGKRLMWVEKPVTEVHGYLNVKDIKAAQND